MATTPDKHHRRVTVILGTGGSSEALLELVLPLLAAQRDVEMQGVFLEEAEVQHAAELPFVKELCRVTFSVREFTSDQFERTLTLRMRTAQRALSVLARRTGVQHSFRNVRGSAVRMVRESAVDSDITVFGPSRPMSPVAAAPRRVERRIAVVIEDVEMATRVLAAAGRLAEGRLDRLTLLLTPEAVADREAIDHQVGKASPGVLLRIRELPGSDPKSIAEAARAEEATLLVVGASDAMLDIRSLQALRQGSSCPVCLVKRWIDEDVSDPASGG